MNLLLIMLEFIKKNNRSLWLLGLLFLMVTACKQTQDNTAASNVKVYQTASNGDKLKEVGLSNDDQPATITISINAEELHQTITGFGGAFTESSAYLYHKLGSDNKQKLLDAYFSDSGANYSLMRTHMNSCDFSIDHYSYAPVANDTFLDSFSIQEDVMDLIPLIKDAQKTSTNGFKIIASPWTAPPWMKDNNDWYGGKLLEEFYPTWANFFVKYTKEYQKLGIPIWAFTVENEPLGNNANWESMHYSPEEMVDFVKNHLSPTLQQNEINGRLLMYDQNRGKELNEWTDVYLKDTALLSMIYGTAVHWYNSTYDWYPESLEETHNKAPNKHIIETEGCIDAEVPHWNDDAWYWSKEATDWGWDWASEEDKKYHPKYVPTFRYARDIIGCLNSHVEGWVDWNILLDEKGGPNLAQNWCIAPVLANVEKDELYFTPLYYVLSHFSKFIRPEAKRISIETSNDKLMATAVKNNDGSIAVQVLNTSDTPVVFELNGINVTTKITIAKQAIQTVLITQ